jgi:hypothetical protein
MANRQDSGSNPAHQNERPTSHNEDALPEMMDDEVRGRADEDDDEEFDESDLEDDGEEEEEDEGSY